MRRGDYTVQSFGRGESLDYRDGHGQLWLRCSGGGASRIYYADTVKLPFSRRERVLENLCYYFDTADNPVIVVVDEDDAHRKDLERLISRLAAEGQKIAIEYETAKRREQFERGWQLSWLRAGKKLNIGGTEIATEEDYLRWKHAQGAAPKSGATAFQDSSSDTKPPPSASQESDDGKSND